MCSESKGSEMARRGDKDEQIKRLPNTLAVN